MTFDENTLAIYVAAYNVNNSNTITLSELEESFFEKGDVFASYNQWVSDSANDEIKHNYFEDVVCALRNEYDVHISEATTDQIMEAITVVNNQAKDEIFSD